MTSSGIQRPPPPSPLRLPPPFFSARVIAGSGPTFHSQVTRGNHRQTQQPHAKRTHDTPLHPLQPGPPSSPTHIHTNYYPTTTTQQPPSSTANLALISVMGMRVATCVQGADPGKEEKKEEVVAVEVEGW
ncbi:Hypothetical predicted protein [Xyrichtys novacula]|uniref:Uncharacterized protein n=1 Tax=Xyrichtys novacula TaxID=13765 RepID=A0AAV1GKL7_XYRNO|nr:Hypothetical predicted protein [Xyrichtys novacula]